MANREVVHDHAAATKDGENGSVRSRLKNGLVLASTDQDQVTLHKNRRIECEGAFGERDRGTRPEGGQDRHQVIVRTHRNVAGFDLDALTNQLNQILIQRVLTRIVRQCEVDLGLKALFGAIIVRVGRNSNDCFGHIVLELFQASKFRRCKKLISGRFAEWFQKRIEPVNDLLGCSRTRCGRLWFARSRATSGYQQSDNYCHHPTSSQTYHRSDPSVLCATTDQTCWGFQD